MKRSRTTSASEAGRYIHLGIAGVLALLAVNHLVALPFLLLEMGYLWKRARRLFVGALFVIGLLLLRYRIVATAPAFQDTSFEGVATSVEEKRFTVRTDGVKVLVYHDGTLAIEPGDRIAVVARIMTSEPRSVEHGFDYGRYLLSEGIRGSVYATRIDILGRTFDVGMIAFGLRRYAEARFDGEALAMVRLFALGDAGALPEELVDSSRDLGISHLFAVSGMHVGAIALFLEALLRRMHLRQGVQAALIGIALLFFTAVTGFAVSIVRAALVYLAVVVTRLARVPFTSTDAIAFVAILVLAIQPFALATAGFRLSYLVSLAIVLGGDLVKDANTVRKTLKIGLLANAAALPILLELNGSFHLLSIPANLIFVLFVDRLAVPAAFFVCFVPAAEPLLDGLGTGFFTAIEAVGAIDLSVALNFSSDLAKAAYWTVAGIALVRLSNGRGIIRESALSISIALVCMTFPTMPGESGVIVFDVGQGDASYLYAPGCRMLVDTGKADPHDTLVDFFRKENVRALDVVVLTHGDDDHVGEIADLDAALTIGAIVAAGDLCPGCRAATERVATGDSLVCGTLSFSVLSAGDAAENDGSIVLFGTVGGDDWIFTGDAGTAVERAVDWPDADILKVGHHGSATSTSAELLSAASPSIAVVSVGRTNGYGHPDEEVLARLEASGTAILRTDLFGTIRFVYPPWGGRILSAYSEDERFGNAANRLLRCGQVFLSIRRRDIMDSVIR